MQDLHGSENDFIWIESSGRLNSKNEFVIIFRDFNSSLNIQILSVLDTLLAETAVLRVFDVNDFSIFIELVNLSWALIHHRSFLLFCQLFVQLLLIQLNQWLLSHNTRRYWGPLGVNLTDSFFGNKFKIKKLVLGQLDKCDWWLINTQFINVVHWR